MDKLLEEELKTWMIEDENKRWEKLERERVRYPKMLEEMGINLLRLDNKIVMDVACGPISALEFLPEAKERIGVDPLIEEYAKIYPQDETVHWINGTAEELTDLGICADLIICMNALDHFISPWKALCEMKKCLEPGGYLGIHCCENNATNNPHPAHKINISYSLFRSWVNSDFETVVSRRVRYGWRKYRGKVGQPAFCWLGRDVRKT